MDIKQELKEHEAELIELRRDLHQYPELGLEEYRTSKIIFDYLSDLGLEVSRCLETGVVALLHGNKKGKTLMLRADIDALPIMEETGLSFASKNEGIMHACGHDGHTAIMLVTAKILTKYKDKINGTIKFVFQPNEEDAGAQLMIDEGVLEDPKPDAIVGAHLWSAYKTGEIGIVEGPIMASSYYFKIIVEGRQGHGGAPHKAINPIDASAHIINAINSLQSFEYDAQKPTVISIGKIVAGTKNIVIPEKLEMEGSIRCLHNDDSKVRERFVDVVSKVAQAYRCKATIEFKCGNSIVNNDRYLTRLVEDIGMEVVGKENVITKDVSVMLGDDFAEFVKDIPGVYFFIGVANKEKGTDYEHHHPKFDIDEDALNIALEINLKIVFEYFKSSTN